jgi:hypothetical protein
MAIKKFGAPEPGDTPKNEPAAERKSPFSPWLGKPDATKKPLGDRVYSSGTTEGGKYTDNGDLMEALLLKAEEAFRQAEQLIKLYERASRNPTRANVQAYSDAIAAVIASDKEISSAVLSVLVATLTATFRTK